MSFKNPAAIWKSSFSWPKALEKNYSMHRHHTFVHIKMSLFVVTRQTWAFWLLLYLYNLNVSLNEAVKVIHG